MEMIKGSIKNGAHIIKGRWEIGEERGARYVYFTCRYYGHINRIPPSRIWKSGWTKNCVECRSECGCIDQHVVFRDWEPFTNEKFARKKRKSVKVHS
jgi:hypothetical protein